jgi:hypothetical protein
LEDNLVIFMTVFIFFDQEISATSQTAKVSLTHFT